MASKLSDDDVIQKLLDSDIEFDTIQLELMPPEDLVGLLQILRGHVLMLSSMIDELHDQVKAIEAFARPKTKRYFYGERYERTIQ